ncbi:MAG TPA: hypothetical protein OIL92_07895 [Oscillospiraceae bacterium]|nr:hypothetical protein [Oscillospiraceae bacterium]
MLLTKEILGGRTKFSPKGARQVKGVALKTHEGLRPSTLQAFEKA